MEAAANDEAPCPVMFWGSRQSSREVLVELPALKSTCPPPQPQHQTIPRSGVRASASLPDLQCAGSKQLLQEEPRGAHSSSRSLLMVLQTLWRSIATDTNAFVSRIADGHTPQVANAKYLNAPYYNSGVFREDRTYFLKEREAELNQELVRKRMQYARELHCASDDRQEYLFDRRPSSKKASARGSHEPRRRESKQQHAKMVETRLIDKHDHKIQHLLHVLQAEIANETEREIRSLRCWNVGRAASRQSRRVLPDIVKERYEAADRIMRILEDYHLVVGVDAAQYLEQAIAEGLAIQSK